MAVELADVKAELRLDHDFEDNLIVRKIAAAQDYVYRAIGKNRAYASDGAVDEAVIKLACHLYEWRGVATDGAMSVIPMGINDLIRSARYASPDHGSA